MFHSIRAHHIAALIASITVSASHADLYVIQQNGKLRTLNPADGSTTLIGNTTIKNACSLDFGPDGMLYTHTQPEESVSIAALYRIDPSDGSSELIGALDSDYIYEGGMCIQSDGTAIAIGGQSTNTSSLLFGIDLAQADTVDQGSIDISDANGLVQRSDGVLISWSQFVNGIFSIDLDAMQTNLIGEDLGGIFSTRTIGGMTTSDGQTGYIIAGSQITEGNQPPSQLIHVDLYTGEFLSGQEVAGHLNIRGIAASQESCVADFETDGQLNFLDVSAFLQSYGNQSLDADLNGDEDLNFLDVSAFLQAFGAGCP